MRIILDAREYDSFDPETPGKYGASEPLVMRVAAALVAAGHRVEGVWKGEMEKFVDEVTWWPHQLHPKTCDVLISCEWLLHAHEFEYDRLYVPLNKNNPILANLEKKVDGFVVFNEEHARQLVFYSGGAVDEKQCIVIPPGVEMPPRSATRRKVKNRMIWCHTPERGLVHLLRQWPEIKRAVPSVSLTMTYGLDRSWDTNKWLMDTIAEELLECRRLKSLHPESIHDIGRVTKEAVQRAQGESEVMSYPCDAPLPGIFTAFAAMECAAVGNALILPHLEGLPDVFGSIAMLLEYPIVEEQWIDVTVELLRDEVAKKRKAKEGREWAAEHPWSEHAEKWAELVS